MNIDKVSKARPYNLNQVIMKFFKIVLGLILSFYLIFGLVAGILVGSDLKVDAVASGSAGQKPSSTTPIPSTFQDNRNPIVPITSKTIPDRVQSSEQLTNSTTAVAAPKTPVKPLGVDLEGALGFNSCNISGQKAAASADALQVCVKGILQFALTMAGIIAIIQLGVAAFNYFNPSVSEDVVKQSIDTIRNIFIGLMLIAAPVVILRTFNVSLTNFGFLGFSASSSGSTNSGGPNATEGNADTTQIGGVSLSPTDTASNINNINQAVEKLKTGEITGPELIEAVNYIVGSIDLKDPNVDVAAVTQMLDTVKTAGIGYTPDPNFLSKLNGAGSKPDGNQTATSTSYCSIDGCEIVAGAVTSLTITSQSLRVSLKDKNSNPTDYLLVLRPLNSIPKPISDFMSLTPSAAGSNPTVTITKKSITSSEFAQWCSAATSQTASNGGAACQKSQASSGSVITGPTPTV